MATKAAPDIRRAARELARSGQALLDALDAWDASDYAADATQEILQSLVYLDYTSARARLAGAVGAAGPTGDVDGDADEGAWGGDPDGGGYRV